MRGGLFRFGEYNDTRMYTKCFKNPGVRHVWYILLGARLCCWLGFWSLRLWVCFHRLGFWSLRLWVCFHRLSFWSLRLRGFHGWLGLIRAWLPFAAVLAAC